MVQNISNGPIKQENWSWEGGLKQFSIFYLTFLDFLFHSFFLLFPWLFLGLFSFLKRTFNLQSAHFERSKIRFVSKNIRFVSKTINLNLKNEPSKMHSKCTPSASRETQEDHLNDNVNCSSANICHTRIQIDKLGPIVNKKIKISLQPLKCIFYQSSNVFNERIKNIGTRCVLLVTFCHK